MQQESKTSTQEDFCPKPTTETEHSSPMDTFNDHLNELMELEVSLSESAQLLLDIAIKQVCRYSFAALIDIFVHKKCSFLSAFTFTVALALRKWFRFNSYLFRW